MSSALHDLLEILSDLPELIRTLQADQRARETNAVPTLCHFLLQPKTSLEVASQFRPILASLICHLSSSQSSSPSGSDADPACSIVCLVELLEMAPYLTR